MRNAQRFDIILSPTEYEEWQRGEGIWFRILGPMPEPTEPVEPFKWDANADSTWFLPPKP